MKVKLVVVRFELSRCNRCVRRCFCFAYSNLWLLVWCTM